MLSELKLTSFRPYSNASPIQAATKAQLPFFGSSRDSVSFRYPRFGIRQAEPASPVPAVPEILQRKYDLIDALPKAELHVHLFGTLERGLRNAIARRNGFPVPEDNPEDFQFKDLPTFINKLDQGTSVFRTEQDFYDITYAYLKKMSAQNVKYVELIFDPQSLEEFGVGFETFIAGIDRARKDAEKNLGIKCDLQLCFVRHAGGSPEAAVASAMRTLKTAAKSKDKILSLGLAGAELGFPPEVFEPVFKEAKAMGFHNVTVHSDEVPREDGKLNTPAALERLKARRIDHGIQVFREPNIVQRLVDEQIPLTICPVSNLRLGFFSDMQKHTLKQMLEKGLLVSIHSDDPSYFFADLRENYREAAKSLDLSEAQLIQLAKNSFKSSFLSAEEKQRYLQSVDEAVGRFEREHPKV